MPLDINMVYNLLKIRDNSVVFNLYKFLFQTKTNKK